LIQNSPHNHYLATPWKRLRIVLVHPAGSNWIPGKKDITAIANRMAPLGLLSIAAYLKQEGHAVFVHDCLGPGAVTSHFANTKKILEYRPDIVGFSATTSGFLDGYLMAESIKKANNQVRIIFGGVHISALGSVLLEQFNDIDFLCMGEGEITLSQLASGKDVSTIDGLIWKEGNQVRTNPVRSQIADLDTLPFPAYELLEGFPKGYHLPLFSYIRSPGATMVTSRGCPYQCSYCDRSVFGRGYRYHSAQYIYEHMRCLRNRFGIRHINIYDDLFTMHQKRVENLCKLLTSKPLGIQFNCAARVGHADDQLLKMLKEAGALQISVGIESGDQDLLEVHKPGVYLDEVRDTINRIQKNGLRAKGLFMMGLPGETVESIKKTSDFLISLGLDDMNMSKFTPFPGAPIWKTIREHGTLDNDWCKMNCLNFVFVPKGIDSKETLDQLYKEHVKRFYSGPQWRNKFRGRLWEHRGSIWHFIKHIPTFLEARRTFEPNRS
jgi:anaerobic magnesium-protoporphyrin IX monomethyl ester cyclase